MHRTIQSLQLSTLSSNRNHAEQSSAIFQPTETILLCPVTPYFTLKRFSAFLQAIFSHSSLPTIPLSFNSSINPLPLSSHG